MTSIIGLLNHFKTMLKHKLFDDLNIETRNGPVLKAHKNFLAVSSRTTKKKKETHLALHLLLRIGQTEKIVSIA